MKAAINIQCRPSPIIWVSSGPIVRCKPTRLAHSRATRPAERWLPIQRFKLNRFKPMKTIKLSPMKLALLTLLTLSLNALGATNFVTIPYSAEPRATVVSTNDDVIINATNAGTGTWTTKHATVHYSGCACSANDQHCKLSQQSHIRQRWHQRHSEWGSQRSVSGSLGSSNQHACGAGSISSSRATR